jgi:RNA polymerase sigma factor (sigma-70 family)
VNEPAPDPVGPTDRPENAQDRAALVDALFREHNEALLRFLALRLRSHHEAKEVAQEAYVKLLRLEDPGAISFLRTFLFTIAANLATDRMRARQRQPREVAALFEEFKPAPLSPEQLLASEQELSVVEKLIAGLAPKCRRVLLLHRISGLSALEIAAQMGLSERMVRYYLVQAITRLRTGLDAATGRTPRKSKENPHG